MRSWDLWSPSRDPAAVMPAGVPIHAGCKAASREAQLGVLFVDLVQKLVQEQERLESVTADGPI